MLPLISFVGIYSELVNDKKRFERYRNCKVLCKLQSIVQFFWYSYFFYGKITGKLIEEKILCLQIKRS